jgi:hypothetical protein
MPKYYATLVIDGKEPLGSDRKLLFELKTDDGAIRRAKRYLARHGTVRVYRYRNFYDDKTFTRIYESGYERVSAR